jgi:hypothetical protein
MAVRVNRDKLSQRLATVMQRHRHRGRRGVKTEQQHVKRG